MIMTERDVNLLEALTLRVPLLTTTQIAERWWPHVRSRQIPHGRLVELKKAGWITRAIVNAQPVTYACFPLFAWKPGGEFPNAADAAQKARSRWSSPAQATEVWSATDQAAYLIGGTANGLLPLEQRDHALRLAEVYFRYLQHHPKLAGFWIGQHALPKAGYGRKDVDALLRNDTGRVLRVIHVAGRWSRRQVERFHEYCVQWKLSYELW